MDENAIAKVAGRQRGVVTARQMKAAGFDEAAIKRRCRAGRLHRLHRGVYLVGHPVAPELAAEVAALLACGPGSVLSHRSAARLWKLPGFRRPIVPVEVTVPGRLRAHRTGIRVYASHAVDRRDVRRIEGIPATGPGRTLLDLAAVLPFDEVEVAFMDAWARRLLRERDLSEMLNRNAGRRGTGQLRRLIELERGSRLTRSEAERRLLALVRSAGLPLPRANARVDTFEVDFLWQAPRVIVEVDGYAFHGGERAFQRNRERDAALAAHGYVVLRVTWRQLIARREAVIARLAATLSLRS